MKTPGHHHSRRGQIGFTILHQRLPHLWLLQRHQNLFNRQLSFQSIRPVLGPWNLPAWTASWLIDRAHRIEVICLIWSVLWLKSINYLFRHNQWLVSLQEIDILLQLIIRYCHFIQHWLRWAVEFRQCKIIIIVSFNTMAQHKVSCGYWTAVHIPTHGMLFPQHCDWLLLTPIRHSSRVQER